MAAGRAVGVPDFSKLCGDGLAHSGHRGAVLPSGDPERPQQPQQDRDRGYRLPVRWCARCARTVGNAHNKGPTLPAKLPVGDKAWAANGGLLTLPASRLGVTSVWPASRASCWPGAPPLQRVASRRGSYGAGLDRARGTAARTEVASRTDALNGIMKATHAERKVIITHASVLPHCRMFVRPFRVTRAVPTRPRPH